MTSHTHRVYLSLGSNLGDKRLNLDRAISEIGRMAGHVGARSAYLETEPWGFESDNTFYNACIALDTTLSPDALLAATQQIEKSLGRTAKTGKDGYQDRLIDIDILLYDDLCLCREGLQIPHPHLHERLFVLKPLDEIAHGTIVPGSNKSVGEMLSALLADE